MIVTIGENNAVTYSFDASEKTLTISGYLLSNIADVRSIKNVSRSNEQMFVSGFSSSGTTNTLTLRAVPAGSTDDDEIEIKLYIAGDFEDFDDEQVLFHKSWSSQKIQSAINAGGGGGGGAVTSLILTAPDSTQWEVTVNNEGAIVTTEV